MGYTSVVYTYIVQGVSKRVWADDGACTGARGADAWGEYNGARARPGVAREGEHERKGQGGEQIQKT